MKNEMINKRYKGETGEIGLKYGIIEATTQCQLACPGCYMVRRNTLRQGQMTLMQAVNVLDQCRDFCGRELETMDILGGEPLLWPFLKEYIGILLKRGIAPWIFTNMLAATPELVKWLRDREVHITGKLNIDPNSKSQYELQAKMIGRDIKTAERLLEAINIFIRAGYKDPLLRLQNLIRKDTINYVQDYYRWCLENEVGTDLELMASGECINEEYWRIAPTSQMIAQMIKEVQRVRESFGLEPAEVLMPHVFGSCPFYDKGLYFAVDGHIRSCSNSIICLSNIDEAESVKKAWESRLLCDRRSLSQMVVGEPCFSCDKDKWKKCRGGCRATVEGMGNPFGGYTLCPIPYL